VDNRSFTKDPSNYVSNSTGSKRRRVNQMVRYTNDNKVLEEQPDDVHDESSSVDTAEEEEAVPEVVTYELLGMNPCGHQPL